MFGAPQTERCIREGQPAQWTARLHAAALVLLRGQARDALQQKAAQQFVDLLTVHQVHLRAFQREITSTCCKCSAI